jgi:lipid-binding SYLF domain-containing protein
LIAAQEEPSKREVAKAEELASERQDTLAMAASTMSRLREEAPESGELIDKAYGYAVFDATKGGLIVSGAGGKGVAQRQGGRDPVFMRMRSVGVGLTAGGETYKLVLLFEDSAAFEQFIEGQRDFKGSAEAVAGGAAAGAATRFEEGVAVYHLSDKGLLGNVDMSSVKFSKDDDLNEKL